MADSNKTEIEPTPDKSLAEKRNITGLKLLKRF